jgi:predicted RNA-binding Zn-ribbon protein involved in translation (DUF1610 family)
MPKIRTVPISTFHCPECGGRKYEVGYESETSFQIDSGEIVATVVSPYGEKIELHERTVLGTGEKVLISEPDLFFECYNCGYVVTMSGPPSRFVNWRPFLPKEEENKDDN